MKAHYSRNFLLRLTTHLLLFEYLQIIPVIPDNEFCTFKINSIEADNMWGYTLKAYLENKTDLELMFSLSNVSVNGFMCDPLWAATVTSGMKSNEEISFTSESFERNGIVDVTDITFTLSVYDNNDWAADHLVSEEFTIYPLAKRPFSPTPAPRLRARSSCSTTKTVP